MSNMPSPSMIVVDEVSQGPVCLDIETADFSVKPSVGVMTFASGAKGGKTMTFSHPTLMVAVGENSSGAEGGKTEIISKWAALKIDWSRLEKRYMDQMSSWFSGDYVDEDNPRPASMGRDRIPDRPPTRPHRFPIGDRVSLDWIEERVINGLMEQRAYARPDPYRVNRLKDTYTIAYRTENHMGRVLRCALGFLIPDDRYDSRFEGRNWSEISGCFPEYDPFKELLSRIQHSHDSSLSRGVPFDRMIADLRVIFSHFRQERPYVQMNRAPDSPIDTDEPIVKEMKYIPPTKPYYDFKPSPWKM